MALARVTGPVLGVDVRSGNKDGKPWSMTTARILVANQDVTHVGISDRDTAPEQGELVDWLVEVRKSGSFLNIDKRAEFPAFASA